MAATSSVRPYRITYQRQLNDIIQTALGIPKAVKNNF